MGGGGSLSWPALLEMLRITIPGLLRGFTILKSIALEGLSGRSWLASLVSGTCLGASAVTSMSPASLPKDRGKLVLAP